MKITLGRLMSALEALNRIVAVEMPASMAFALVRRAAWIAEEHTAFQVVQNALIGRFGEPAPKEMGAPADAKHVAPGMKGWADYVSEMSMLANEVIDFPFEPLSIEGWGINISAVDLGAVSFLFGEVEPVVSEEAKERRARFMRLAETGSTKLN